MPSGPIRRSQLIAPFGVGAMVVVRGGISLISGGLDHWFEYESGEADSSQIDKEEYLVEEWRLQRRLTVNRFYLPPDYRIKGKKPAPNTKLSIPFLRFPQAHFCPWCKRLENMPLTERSFLKCVECATRGKKNYLVQVPFVAMCDCGHIQDFPWREWVHRSATPDCNMPIRLFATGGSTLAAQEVRCDCGKTRNLAQIMNTDQNGENSFLSRNLDESGTFFYCQGKRPWLGTEESSKCQRPLRGTLRSASNVHFADQKSAIYLPRSSDDAPEDLVSLMEEPPLSSLIKILLGAGAAIVPEMLRGQQRTLLQPYSDLQIAAALKIISSGASVTIDTVDGDDDETAFRRAEFNVIKDPRTGDQLSTKQVNLAEYEAEIVKYFSNIMLVEKLRETRALTGFTRVMPENSLSQKQRKDIMWLNPPTYENSWLPAYVVYGEGIFIEFDYETLNDWENREDVKTRIIGLSHRFGELQRKRGIQEQKISSRFLLLHTFSHVLMNRLTFECGYSSASLRERLYISDNKVAPMAGLLIYTAAGDSEGTLGGLVRMGKAGYLEPVIRRALEGAHWCSADPVCMEIGARGGQGPDSCNLAACHNCALVPETACEQFNRFLDRALLIGDSQNNLTGYFS
jgi:Domain of unknown function (DUF1998)